MAAGSSQPRILEALVGVTMKTLSNYTNHGAETPLDARPSPTLKKAWRSLPSSMDHDDFWALRATLTIRSKSLGAFWAHSAFSDFLDETVVTV